VEVRSDCVRVYGKSHPLVRHRRCAGRLPTKLLLIVVLLYAGADLLRPHGIVCGACRYRGACRSGRNGASGAF